MTIAAKSQLRETTNVGIGDELQQLCDALYCNDLHCNAKWKPYVVTVSRNKALNRLYQWRLKCDAVAMYCSLRIVTLVAVESLQ